MLYIWSLSWLQITFWRSFLLYWFFVACRTPWSIGWIREAVFGGRNRQVTEPPRLLSSSGWAEQLSINSRAFGERMFCERWWLFTAGTKSFLNHSSTISEFIQAFLWDLWITASASMLTCLKHLGFPDFPRRTGFSWWVPVAFVQPSTVKRSFALLNPGADFSRQETRVLCGKHFHKSPVSSAL